MRFVHLADTHLGCATYRKTSENGYNQREEDINNAFAQAIDKIIELKPDFVLHAGDLFDSVRPTNRIIHFAITQILKLSKANIPLILISGNHETPKQRYMGHVFKILEAIAGENTHILYKEELHKLNIKGVNIFAIPQCTKDETYKTLLKEATPIDGEKNILMLHTGVSGMKEFSHGDFNELLVDYNYFKEKKFDYYALGHYHGFVQVGENAYFAGSTERLSFNEAGQEKGFIEVDMSNIQCPIFHKINTRPMIELLEINADGKSANEIMEILEQNLKEVKPKGKILRQKIKRIKPETLAAMDIKKIRELAAEAIHFEPIFEKVEESGNLKSIKIAIGGLNEEYASFISEYPNLSEQEKTDLKTIGQLYLAEEMEKEA